MHNPNRILFSGAPGAGKTTLLKCLHAAGFSITPESARSVIQDRQSKGLTPRPEDFGQQLLDRDIETYQAASALPGAVFFDRGVPDALAMLHFDNATNRQYLTQFPYHNRVFFFEAWPDIYRTDDQRDQTLAQAFEVAASLRRWYEKLGFSLISVPQADVETRKQFVIDLLNLTAPKS